MNSNYYWTCIAGIAIGTYLVRCSFILFHEYIKLPRFIKKGLPYLPVAILPALISPSIIFHVGQVHWLYGNERALAACTALLVSYKTKNMIATIVVGFLTLFFLKTMS
tara:strand:- start:186903 stop:187226 length:324 start_codon:yes stop_codon:yes gene_type:complete